MTIPPEYFLYFAFFVGGLIAGFCAAVYAAAGLPEAAERNLKSIPRGEK
jgi:hypothetical protein